LTWCASAIAETSVIEHEHGVPGFRKRHGELAETGSSRQTEAVAHHDASCGHVDPLRHEEPSAAHVVTAPQLHIGFSNAQALRLGNLQRFINPTAFADQHSQLDELRRLVEGHGADETPRAAVQGDELVAFGLAARDDQIIGRPRPANPLP
jgi:hypothetical protein